MKFVRRVQSLLKRQIKTHIFRRRMVTRLLFETNAACQNNCRYCAHGDMMKAFPAFQLSLEELKEFIRCTRLSGYYIKDVVIHGIGEPTLWKYFNEGVELLHRSGTVNRILIVSNGLSLDRIKPRTWKYIFSMSLSIYPDFMGWDQVNALRSKHGDKIIVNKVTDFGVQPNRKHEGSIPCKCLCAGPMFIKDRIYYYCGPPVYSAAALKGVDITAVQGLSTPIKQNYLDGIIPSCRGNLDLCQYCSANENIERQREPHSYL